VSSYDGKVDELVTQYEETRAKSGQLRKRISEATGTAAGPRRCVSVTVKASGEVAGIEFPTEAYKTMPTRELSKVLLGALSEARDAALESAGEIVAAELPGFDFAGMVKGTADVPLRVPPLGDVPGLGARDE
jgi:DNA-binding protein YbaB